ncbi:MAG TPA: DNA polymerase Y family protein [Acetobacteraceae bacterium]
MMRRILSVWLPHWPITRLTRGSSASPDRPLVTVETIRGVRHLVAVGGHGEAQGLRPGQTLTDARAVCPSLLPVEAEPAGDEAALARLAAWCERYTPMAAPDPPDGLWLDITGCTFLPAADMSPSSWPGLSRPSPPAAVAQRMAGTRPIGIGLEEGAEKSSPSPCGRGVGGGGWAARRQDWRSCDRPALCHCDPSHRPPPARGGGESMRRLAPILMPVGTSPAMTGKQAGGEACLVQDLASRLERDGIPCRLAIAGTTGAAWALARMGKDQEILPPGGEKAALADLPVAGLRLDTGTVTGLRRLGLRTVGDLLQIPRAQITARFGAMPVLRLDQALGAMEEAIDWPRPPIEWQERLAFAEPIGTPEDLARALTRLAERLCGRLAEQDKGGRRFVARFFRVDEVVPQIAVTTALAVRDPGYLTRLLGEKLDTVDPGFGVEVIALEAEIVAPLQAPQGRLADLATPDATDRLAGVVDTLTNRLGSDQMSRAAPYASHVPERAVRHVPPLPVSQPSWVNDPGAPRPIRLLRRPEEIEVIAPVPDDPPIRFSWRGVAHRVRAAAGPERIAAEWWRGRRAGKRPDTDLVRDYYRVEDSDGARFWIFRAGLHAEDRMPRWYLHGLFG